MPFGVVPLVGTWIEITLKRMCHRKLSVVPLVGTWIEISQLLTTYPKDTVVPLVGTWIEISKSTFESNFLMSFLS